MTAQVEENPSFGKRLLRGLGWFLKFLLRLTFVIVVGVGLGLGVYFAAVFGVQIFNAQIMQPIRDNTQRLVNLEANRSSDLEMLDQRLSTAQKQVDALTSQGDNHREYIDSVTNRLVIVEDAVEDALNNVATAQLELDALVSETGKVPPHLEDVDDALMALESASDGLAETLSTLQTDLSELTVKVEDDNFLTVLQYDVMILKAMESLTRARLFLSQDNAGLASEEILAARDMLLILKGMVPDFQKDAVQAILNRLDLSRDNLTSATVVAVDDLEAAWQLLLIGLPVTASGVAPLSVIPTETLTATGTLTVTPAITGTTVITP